MCTSLKSGSIAIAVIHIFCGLYFIVIGAYAFIFYFHITNPEYQGDYYLFVMVCLISEGIILLGICTSLLVGVTKKMPKLLIPFLIWVFIAHLFLNTAFLIFTIFVFVNPSSRWESIGLDLHYLYIVKGAVYYIVGAISFFVVFRLFRSMKHDEAKKVVNV